MCAPNDSIRPRSRRGARRKRSSLKRADEPGRERVRLQPGRDRRRAPRRSCGHRRTRRSRVLGPGHDAPDRPTDRAGRATRRGAAPPGPSSSASASSSDRNPIGVDRQRRAGQPLRAGSEPRRSPRSDPCHRASRSNRSSTGVSVSDLAARGQQPELGHVRSERAGGRRGSCRGYRSRSPRRRSRAGCRGRPAGPSPRVRGAPAAPERHPAWAVTAPDSRSSSTASSRVMSSTTPPRSCAASP